MTGGRRWRRWTNAGIFDQLPRILLAALPAAGAIDWSRAGPGSKHHLICDGGRLPLKVIITGEDVNDVSLALDLVDGIAPVAGRPGWPRRRPEAWRADNGYHSHRLRRELARRRIVPIISYRGTTGVQRLGQLRYVVEQTLALLHQFTRLAVRFERHLDLHQALVCLACAHTCRRRLKNRRPRSCWELLERVLRGWAVTCTVLSGRGGTTGPGAGARRAVGDRRAFDSAAAGAPPGRWHPVRR